MKYSLTKNSLLLKLNFLSKILSILLILPILLFSGCKKDNPNPIPSIESFSPASGKVGTLVTINGLNFSTTLAENVVKFNGVTAELNGVSSNQIVAIVPAGATTGKISVDVKGVATSSALDFTVLPDPPTVTSFAPASGGVGTVVTITGTFFSTTLSDNIVAINGVSATVNTASATQLTVTVPQGATTGKIAVTVNAQTGISTADFTILATPIIASFIPTFYDTSNPLPSVTIIGTNFSTAPGDNIVKFNGTTAIVTNVTATQLTVMLPSGATSGKITVITHGVTGISTTDFLIGCPDVTVTDITVTGLSGNLFGVTYHIKNVGGIPLDINNMFLQAYVAQAATLSGSGGNSVGAGGFSRFSTQQTYPLLAPNETLELQANPVNNGNNSISTYPYVILSIVRETNGPIECNITNNDLGKKIQP